MKLHHRHTERHRTDRIGWLRAAVLGANDGIVSTASLVVGVAAASASHGSILLTGVAGLVAGAMSMAAGEYVSVHSQADTEEGRPVARARRTRSWTRPRNGVNWRPFMSRGGWSPAWRSRWPSN